MARRKAGNGSVRLRKDGRWEGRAVISYDEKGKKKKKNVLAKTKRECQEKLDKLEALISHNESDLSTWLPLEYDLQLTYGQENMQFSQYLKELRALIDTWTRDKIEKESGTDAADQP